MKIHKLVLGALSLILALFALTACGYANSAIGGIEQGLTVGSGADAANPDSPIPPSPDGEQNDGINYDTLVVSKVDALNVRSGKGTNFPSVGTLDIPQNSFAKFSIRPLTTFINIIAKHYKQSFDIKHKITAIQKLSYILDFI